MLTLGDCEVELESESLRGVDGPEATFAKSKDALVGLPDPESLRAAMGA